MTRFLIALPIAWHAISLGRAVHKRKTEHRFWLALDVVGTFWALTAIPTGLQHERVVAMTQRYQRNLLRPIFTLLRLA